MLIKLAKTIWSKIKTEVKISQYKENAPPEPMHDDIYLVEFPKSGVTWLSFILANILLLKNNKKDKVTYYNYSRYIPDIHQLRGAKINKLGDFRFIKSHSEYNPIYNFVVYILRNPVDVMVSYFNFMTDLDIEMEFDDFVKSEKYGVKNWVNHVNGWLNNSDKPQRIHLIKYEDLKQDVFFAINELCLNLGINVDDEIIKKAIKNSDLKAMKESEELYRKYNSAYDVSFVGKENKKRKKELLTPDIEDYIRSETREIIEKYYID